ncbi:MAG: hypothetical protein KGS72_28935, partial [Cyanobacteria bacterium REEB67]|nr:hypothetical protein [Cyanobacteria bacterium REEB67]
MFGHSNKTTWMIGVSLVIVILATIAASVLFQRQQAIYHCRERLVCNQHILATIGRLEASAQDAEDSALGYGLTGSPQLLKARNRAIENYHLALANLSDLERAYGKPVQDLDFHNDQLSGLPDDISAGISLSTAQRQTLAKGAGEAHSLAVRVDSAQALLAAMSKSRQALAEALSVQLRDRILQQNVFIATTATLYILGLFASLLSFIYIFNQKTAASNRTRVQLAVTQALMQSNNLDEAGRRVLEAIGRIYNFSFGAIWFVDEKAHLIKPHTLW